MKVLHIIPSAFNYFDDIRADAFSLVSNLAKFGVEVEALTIQFAAPGKAEKEEVSIVAPARHYQGESRMKAVEAMVPGFDLIHAHCPLFGAAGRLLAWKRRWPQIPLLVTAHRPVATPDFFSLLVVAYNWLYLPRLFGAASAIVCPDLKKFKAVFWRCAKLYRDKVAVVDDSL